MLPVVVVALCVLGGIEALTEQVSVDATLSVKEWNATITDLLAKHMKAFNDQDIDDLVDEFMEGAHRLAHGKPIAIGKKAIREQYEQRKRWTPMEDLQMTDLRFFCDKDALAETASVFANNVGTGKGLIHVRLVNDEPKFATYAFNYD